MTLRLAVLVLTGCGRLGFDPAAPDLLAYGRDDELLVYNDVEPALTAEVFLSPRLQGLATSFSIEPDLTAATGLSFDTGTGKISGFPDRASRDTYTITASSELGDASLRKASL